MNRINPENTNDANDAPTYKPEVLAAIREFRAAKPWRGTIEERKPKFTALHEKLCNAYSLQSALVFAVEPIEELHGNGQVNPLTNELTIIGRLSVVTYLMGFAMLAFGGRTEKAHTWAVILYKRMFPRSAERMSYVNGFVIKPENLN